MRNVVAILFDDFETLDLFGPVEVLGRLNEQFRVRYFSAEGGVIRSAQDVPVVTESFDSVDESSCVLLIPGGIGTRALVSDEGFINRLRNMAESAEFILTVCTGSILFSKTGLLAGRRATSNKRVFFWAGKESPGVRWIKEARWVRDGNIYTSSGVSAGIDMTLSFVADLLGPDIARQQSREIEYIWNEDPGHDPFANLY